MVDHNLKNSSSSTLDLGTKSVLIIEDEPAIAELISLTLFQLRVHIEKAFSAEQARFLLQNKSYDLICVDWMLPGEQGVDLVKNLKIQNPQQMILMVTAKSDPESIVKGLENGADDYISKPFDMKILMARAKNLLIRSDWVKRFSVQLQTLTQNTKTEIDIVELEGLKIDFARIEVTFENQLIHLTPSEFKLLGYLMKSQGRVLTRDQLIDLIQGEDVSVTGRTIDTHVFALRKKLTTWADHIETIRGVGYRVSQLT